jgi:phage shock protein A
MKKIVREELEREMANLEVKFEAAEEAYDNAETDSAEERAQERVDKWADRISALTEVLDALEEYESMST